MLKTIIKRDGSEVTFNHHKITTAIKKANLAVSNEKMDENDVSTIKMTILNALLKQDQTPTVEGVQDLVETTLILNHFPKTAKAYILYRAERSKARKTESVLFDIFEQLTNASSDESDIQRENANINADTAMGTMLKFGTESTKYYNLKHVIPPHIAKAHKSGDIHIHDLDFFNLTTTCCQMDLLKLFDGGFSTGHGSQREPQTIRSFSALACIAIQSNQNDQHGGQSLNNFDYAMALGVKRSFRRNYFNSINDYFKIKHGINENHIHALTKSLSLLPTQPKMNDDDYVKTLMKIIQSAIPELSDKKIETAHKYAIDHAIKTTDKETFKSMVAFIHNLNTMASRAGAQVPFSSINYGTDTSLEGQMVIKNILLATKQGLGNGETPIFPVQIFKVKEGINYNAGDPNYDLFKLAMETSAKRLFPNFSFLDAPFNLQYYKEGDYDTEVAYMGCRTRVMGNTYDPSYERSSGRGNLSFTSINLPRIALEANNDINHFYELLDKRINLIIEQLLHRFKIQSEKQVKNFPFLMGEGVWHHSDRLKDTDQIGEILKHGTLSVGFIGLAETLITITGRHHGEDPESQKLGLEIITHIRKKLDIVSREQNLNFTLIATPAEGLSGRFVKLDKERFGLLPGITDKDYYTNSFHIPVDFPLSAYDKIKIEAPYHEITNAGHITYVELDGNASANPQAFEAIIRCMKESGIGYGSINHPIDRDPLCGYNGIIGKECPNCGRRENNDQPNFERIRRISGYLVGTMDRWNDAKRAEEKDQLNMDKTLRINAVIPESITDGVGLRFVIFTQGCPHHCPGCHNPQTHNINGGYDIEINDLYDQICKNPLLQGVTFSGGEPFLQAKPLIKLATLIKNKNLDLTTYTGYTYDELLKINNPDQIALIKASDTLIDGRYVEHLRDVSLFFRGSSNQQVIKKEYLL